MLKSTDVYAPQTTILSVEAKRGRTEPLSTLYRHRSDSVRESFAQLNLSPPSCTVSRSEGSGISLKKDEMQRRKGGK